MRQQWAGLGLRPGLHKGRKVVVEREVAEGEKGKNRFRALTQSLTSQSTKEVIGN